MLKKNILLMFFLCLFLAKERNLKLKKIDGFLRQLIDLEGSDLHVAAGSRPMIRKNGILEPTDFPYLTNGNIYELMQEVLTPAEIQKFTSNADLDFVYQSRELDQRFRSNAFYQKNGISMVFRWIKRDIPTLEELGFSEAVKKLTRFHQGIVLVTGPSGCGKTTTMASLIDIINKERSLHIITVEEPVEYIHRNKNSLVIQREVGKDVDSFQTALKGALREDPDVIVIGELRDLDTISLAITAAETGHLVFSTINTNSAIQTIDRIIDSYPSEQQSQVRVMFSESLKAIISQQLIQNTDGTKMVCAYELLIGNSSVSNLIRDSKQYQIINNMHTGKKQGMQLMDSSLLDLVIAGSITLEVALERSQNPSGLEDKYKALKQQS